jgi:uncharacterized protein (TIGR02466 family)
MSELLSLFTTHVYRSLLGGKDNEGQRNDLINACEMLEVEDRAGRSWCRENGYKGYTSYASLNDLPNRMPEFATLTRKLDKHVTQFSDQLGFDLAGGRLKLDSLWVNLMPNGGNHSGHIHPHSVVSGTYYVSLPEGASKLKLEDPRLTMMMAAPTRLNDAGQHLQPFVSLTPQESEVILWESWLRHEVVMNRSKAKRISVSFNYAWV